MNGRRQGVSGSRLGPPNWQSNPARILHKVLQEKGRRAAVPSCSILHSRKGPSQIVDWPWLSDGGPCDFARGAGALANDTPPEQLIPFQTGDLPTFPGGPCRTALPGIEPPRQWSGPRAPTPGERVGGHGCSARSREWNLLCIRVVPTATAPSQDSHNSNSITEIQCTHFCPNLR